MGRRKFTAEFKLEAVKLAVELGMAAMQAARDLGAGSEQIHDAWTFS